jgi:hypothetical protein
MRRKFIVKKHFDGSKKNVFAMKPLDSCISFYCASLVDLKKQLRALTNPYQRMRSTQWWSKHIKAHDGNLKLVNRFFKTTTIEVTEVTEVPKYKEILHTYKDRSGVEHTQLIKVVELDLNGREA